ncbi:MAG TPA: Fe-S cluster assembly protein HesB [Actinomycetota bacterium]|nr:Fe-S cluster assembly protein HesB [Actinomycetota bacterium]
MTAFDVPMHGAGGEPVDLWRTINSHGVASLPPHVVDEDARTLTTVVALAGTKPRRVRIAAGRGRTARVTIDGPAAGERTVARVRGAVRHILALDRDLSAFYALVADDPALAWTVRGAGRMVRSQTVFEEVVKTICTTNCAWSATERMVGALVEHLGEPAAGVKPGPGPAGRAFPTPAAMAEADDDFYRGVVRAGYRGRYFRALARDVADGTLDLEALATDDETSDEDVYKQLIALPGVGPYAAAHIMQMIGRHSRPILDSWTRPTYARLTGKKSVTDKAILRRFARYREHAGLAFWLFLTQDWVAE